MGLFCVKAAMYVINIKLSERFQVLAFDLFKIKIVILFFKLDLKALQLKCLILLTDKSTRISL